MDDNTKKGMNPKAERPQASLMATGLAGMIIGAGVGAAATRIMTDKKLRDRLTNTFSDAKDKIVSYAHRISRETKKAKQSS